MEWAFVPHLYYKFYTWSYAAGLASGIALAEKVAAGEPGAAKRYLDMLAAGSSAPPVEIMRRAGVDLGRPEAMDAAARLLDRTVSEMERLLAKRG